MKDQQLTVPVGPADHVQGRDDAEVTLVEYGDFECPYCGAAYPLLKRVLQRLGTRVRFVFRHFPIAELHPHAESAAEASESVGALTGPEAFWRMHDLLFEHQGALGDQDLAQYAEEAGAVGEVLLNDLEEGRYRAQVRGSFMDGVRSGVNGTPTLFINGTRYDGPRDEETLIGVLSTIAVGPRAAARFKGVSHGR